MGQRTDSICFKVNFSGFTTIVFSMVRWRDGQFCSRGSKSCPPVLSGVFQRNYLIDRNGNGGLVRSLSGPQSQGCRPLNFFQEDIKSVTSDDLHVIARFHGHLLLSWRALGRVWALHSAPRPPSL